MSADTQTEGVSSPEGLSSAADSDAADRSGGDGSDGVGVDQVRTRDILFCMYPLSALCVFVRASFSRPLLFLLA